MNNDQPSPYSTAAVEATVDHLRQRIRELEADLSTVRGERNDLRNLTESLRVCAESSTSIAERYTDKYKELHDAARDLLTAADRSDKERTGAAVERLRSLTLPTPHDCKGLACPCSYPTYAEICAELDKAERQRDELHDAARAVVDAFDGRNGPLPSCKCGAVATLYGCDDNVPIKDLDACDKCSGWLVRPSEYDHAPIWRRLCALVKS